MLIQFGVPAKLISLKSKALPQRFSWIFREILEF